jgi:hypothetical protein
VEEESFQAVEAWRRSSLELCAVHIPYLEEHPYREEEEVVEGVHPYRAALPFLEAPYRAAVLPYQGVLPSQEEAPYLVEVHPSPVEAPYLEGIDLDQTLCSLTKPTTRGRAQR